MSCILDRIQKANDIKKIDEKDYEALAGEIREFIIQSVSENGGHLASNLGVVELTMALHLCLNFPEDKLIWDVGHQSYTHKILTGRKEAFAGLRTYKGMSGFPKHRESECDAFDTGPQFHVNIGSSGVRPGAGYYGQGLYSCRSHRRWFDDRRHGI